jgi:hypothetical protein
LAPTEAKGLTQAQVDELANGWERDAWETDQRAKRLGEQASTLEQRVMQMHARVRRECARELRQFAKDSVFRGRR